MEFCPKCGSLLVKKTKKFGCPRCNYTAKGNIKLEMKEKVDERQPVAVITNKNEAVTLPVIDYQCSKCKSKKAYFWTQESIDEGEEELEFYKCIKCGNTVREVN